MERNTQGRQKEVRWGSEQVPGPWEGALVSAGHAGTRLGSASLLLSRLWLEGDCPDGGAGPTPQPGLSAWPQSALRGWAPIYRSPRPPCLLSAFLRESRQPVLRVAVLLVPDTERDSVFAE